MRISPKLLAATAPLALAAGLTLPSPARADPNPQHPCAPGGPGSSDMTATECGVDADASGIHSTAVGNASVASGPASTAVGGWFDLDGDGIADPEEVATASQIFATALGAGAQATNGGSTATGAGSAASGIAATATGSASVASGDASTATGVGSAASGFASTATGTGSAASGSGSAG